MSEEKKKKIIFIGAGNLGCPSLEKLIENPLYQIEKIITSPDKPAGRQKKLTVSPIKETAFEHEHEVLETARISEAEETIKKISPDLIIVADYGQIIPVSIINIPLKGSLNLHPSLLPKYRGPSPIQAAILNGEEKTGITIILMDKKMDHGPIISQKEMPLNQSETHQGLKKKLAQEAADLLIKTLPRYLSGLLAPQKQTEEKATYTKIVTREDGKIDWSKSALDIERKIRAFHPWPGAWTEIGGKMIKIIKARAVKEKLPCALPAKKGFLKLELVQPAGKKLISGEDFFRGYQKSIDSFNKNR